MAVAAATRIVLPCFAVVVAVLAAAAVAALPSSPSTRAVASSSSREEGDPFGGDPGALFDSLFDDGDDGGDGGGGGGGPCREEAAALRDCMRASGDDLDCAACVTSGLDTTAPLTCGMLGGGGDGGGDAGSESGGGAYCRDVVACVELKCREDCRGEYLAGLDCTLGRECAGFVACSPRVGGKVPTGAPGLRAAATF